MMLWLFLCLFQVISAVADRPVQNAPFTDALSVTNIENTYKPDIFVMNCASAPFTL